MFQQRPAFDILTVVSDEAHTETSSWQIGGGSPSTTRSQQVNKPPAASTLEDLLKDGQYVCQDVVLPLQHHFFSY